MITTDQVMRGWDALIAIPKKWKYFNVSNAASNGLAALAPKLSAEQRPMAANRLLDEVYRSLWMIEIVAVVVKLLDPQNAEFTSTRAATRLLDLANSIKHFQSAIDNEYTPARPVFKSFNNPESLAKLLSHPNCVDQLREFMLTRLDELLFHGGDPVFQILDESEDEVVFDGGDKAEDATVAERRATLSKRRTTACPRNRTARPILVQTWGLR